MIDNRKVKESHQKGIEAKKQRPGDLKKGQGGKMGCSHKSSSRSKSSSVPKKA